MGFEPYGTAQGTESIIGRPMTSGRDIIIIDISSIHIIRQDGFEPYGGAQGTERHRRETYDLRGRVYA